MRHAGKVAIVTGGGSGFGEGIVRKFVTEGARVVLMDRDEATAARVAAEVGENVRPITGDVSTLASFEAAADLARSAFGGLDILVNNAGVAQPPLALDTMDEEMFDRIANGGVSPRPNLTWCNASRAGRLPPPGPWPWNSHRSASASSPPFRA
ncbi:SDR family NAD(P)-dependent oxidoreductase [Mesorhizobium sp. M7A.F.Ca.US.011.01.1.1]|uniref:SDR family NAD(P)-dependent oxidoreductase n=1 Tax=Mesorhizobium sp. M7A.F.Ca.US.011.01.1.1 TaxID=2496741 RepID=UPI001FE03D2B|nr:SDR family NAD(P)-dependent oxidoreductase [Mesorhizobium sp. M7A.F.Ca.US.011.01.1.1]